jgi:hypothetical protein
VRACVQCAGGVAGGGVRPLVLGLYVEEWAEELAGRCLALLGHLDAGPSARGTDLAGGGGGGGGGGHEGTTSSFLAGVRGARAGRGAGRKQGRGGAGVAPGPSCPCRPPPPVPGPQARSQFPLLWQLLFSRVRPSTRRRLVRGARGTPRA